MSTGLTNHEIAGEAGPFHGCQTTKIAPSRLRRAPIRL